MSARLPPKITLDNTTKVSLNDRFTKLSKERFQKRQPPTIVVNKGKTGQKNPNAGGFKPRLATQAVSAKNRRLAQQMANRPSVKAALKIKKRSLNQRRGGGGARGIGGRGGLKRLARPTVGTLRVGRLKPQQQPQQKQATNVKARLGVNPNLNRRLNRRLTIATAGVVPAANKKAGIGARLQSRPFPSRGAAVQRVQRGNRPARGVNRLAGRLNVSNTSANNINKPLRGGINKRRLGGRGGGSASRGSSVVRGGINRRRFGGGQNRGAPRGAPARGGAMRGGRGGGGNRKSTGAPATKESLDNDLDKYMSKTKANLNSDLDIYMSNVN